MRGMGTAAKRPDAGKSPQALNLQQTIQYMWPYLWAFKGRILLAMLALVAAKATTLLLPYALKLIVDGLDRSIHPTIVLPVLLIIGYGLLRFGTVFFGEIRDALFSRVTEHAMRQIGLRVFKHLHQLELSFHLDRNTGGISRDIERGTNGLSFLMRFLMFNIVPTVLEIVLVALIFWNLFSVWYAVITAVAVAVYILFTVRVTEWRNQFIRAANQADSRLDPARRCTHAGQQPAAADGAVVSDTPGAGLTCPAAGNPITCAASGGGACPGAGALPSLVGGGVAVPVLPAGGVVTFTVPCQVSASGF